MRPFRDSNTFDAFGNLEQKIVGEINRIENDYILKASLTELEQHYLDKATIAPIVLKSEEYYIQDTSGTRIDVSRDFNRAVFPGERLVVQGTRIEIAVPFEGDPQLWKMQASSFSLCGYPDIDIRSDCIVIAYTFPDDSPDPDRLKQRIQSDISSLSSAVTNLARDVENHNIKMKSVIPAALNRKHKNSLSAINAVAGLGIPMKRTVAPATYTVPTKRRQLPVSLPKVSGEKFQPEPTLATAEYDHILEILGTMALVIERSPHSFATLDEEAIRTHFLLSLNSHYEGNATGETFNAVGKTDILIRVENKNIFIAECKFWRGQKSFEDALSQLLSYLTWRDSKCALLIFNKTKNSSAVRQKMHDSIEKLSAHKSTISYAPEGNPRYILVKESDPGKEITLTTMLFDIPIADDNGEVQG